MKIEESILSRVSSRWQKTAMIIAKCSENLPDIPANEIALRIGDLVAHGKLELRGDLSEWRHSELRSSMSYSEGVVDGERPKGAG